MNNTHNAAVRAYVEARVQWHRYYIHKDYIIFIRIMLY